MVNCAGDMVIGFSGSSAINYVGAYYSWRLNDGATPAMPRVIRNGLTSYTDPEGRWGDYSATTLDPSDDWSFWTVQEYADPAGIHPGYAPNAWKTVIARIRPNP